MPVLGAWEVTQRGQQVGPQNDGVEDPADRGGQEASGEGLDDGAQRPGLLREDAHRRQRRRRARSKGGDFPERESHGEGDRPFSWRMM